MDFITDLPPSMRGRRAYDAILVIVCRFSKMVRYLPCTVDIDAESMAELILIEIIQHYGVPRSIVSDRGTLFTSKYWGTLCYYLAIRRCLSTAFHPQTDGQTERTNQTLECYLRCYINYHQNDWAMLLPGAEYACNNAVNATTGKVPFHVVYRFEPTMRINIEAATQEGESQLARARMQALEEGIEEMSASWKRAQEQMVKHYNKKHAERTFQEGELVLLSSRHIRIRRASRKLADRYIGPFEVLKKIGKNAYRLQLPPKYGRIHNTFHVSLLEPFHRRPGYVVPEAIDIDNEEEWEVEKILDMRETRQGKQYLVRWKGFSEAEDAWEPAEHIANAQEALKEYQKLIESRPQMPRVRGRPRKNRSR